MEDLATIISLGLCGIVIPILIIIAALVFIILKPAEENKKNLKNYSLDQQKEIENE